MLNSPLNTVQSLIEDVRRLLLDETRPYRYDDTSLLVALNTCLLEARRGRADLFVTRWGGNTVPYYGAVTGDPFCMEPQFRLGFVYGTCAHALKRDDEDIQDERAALFMQQFYHIIGMIPPPPLRGGTPNAGKKG